MQPNRRRVVWSDLRYTNAVYYTNASLYAGHTPRAVNYDCVDLVYYAFAHLASNGVVFLSDEHADASMPVDGARGGIGALLQIKGERRYLKIILSVGGPGSEDTWVSVAASAVLRDNFARSVQGLIDSSGIDGVDIYWPFPADAQQGADFSALLEHTRMYMPRGEYILSAAIAARPDALALLDLRGIALYIDHLNLASYEDSVNPGASSVAAAISFLIAQGVYPKTLLLGVPTFARVLGRPGAPDTSDTTTTTTTTTRHAYRDLPYAGARENLDRRTMSAFSVVDAAGTIVAYDNPQTVSAKATLCHYHRLGGLFYYTSYGDSARPDRSLVMAGYTALHS